LKLLHILTVPFSLFFIRGQVGYMKDRGFHVSVITSPGKQLDEFASEQEVDVCAVEMPRRITPVQDLVSVWRLYRCIKNIKPTIIHSHTPKGGLLGMIAAYSANVPARIYSIRGLPHMTATGYKRVLLKYAEKISCLLAHQVLCVSHSIRSVAVEDGLCPADKIKVLLSGSGNGVDATTRFNPANWPESRNEIREKYGIPDSAVVVGYIGRIVRDKGVVELAEAWKTISKNNPKAYLMLVGPFEPQDPVPAETKEYLESCKTIILLGECKDAAPFYTAIDISVLPTYREGFPNVPLEAAAMELPIVATSVPGCIDAVQDNVTGILVSPKQSDVLAAAIQRYLDDPELRVMHGKAGRERVLREFRQDDLWEAIYQEYVTLLESRGLGLPGKSNDEENDSQPGEISRIYNPVKQILDRLFALILLVFFAPLMFVISALIRLDSPGEALYKQKRIGRYGKEFTIYKFRTMRTGTPVLPTDQMQMNEYIPITKIGSILRKTSIDELPQLINILKGEMSFIGPRPALPSQTDVNTLRAQLGVDTAIPGITGLAQVMGRDDLDNETKVKYDADYCREMSLGFDLKILTLTFNAVKSSRGNK